MDLAPGRERSRRLGKSNPQGAGRNDASPRVAQPDLAARTALVTWLETSLDRAAAAKPNPGRPLVHRLNRTEYANAIRDLLSLDVDTTTLLPPDDSGYGFDNIADVLGVSPVLLEAYVSAAGRISALAVGDPNTGPTGENFRVRQDASQDVHIEGLPLGTVGGLLVKTALPLDGVNTYCSLNSFAPTSVCCAASSIPISVKSPSMASVYISLLSTETPTLKPRSRI